VRTFFASLRFASLRFASLRFASLRFASLRFVPGPRHSGELAVDATCDTTRGAATAGVQRVAESGVDYASLSRPSPSSSTVGSAGTLAA